MGGKIIGFILYLVLSYGVIYALTSKRFRRGWNIGEQQVRAAVLIAMAVIIAVGTMLVGPLPMVLLVVALVAFIDYIRSSETLAATTTDSTPDWRLLPSLIGSIGWLKRELTIASAHRGVDRVRLLTPSLFGSILSLKRMLATASAHHGVDRVRHLAPSLLGSIASLKRTLATASAHYGLDEVRSLLTRKPGPDGDLNACSVDQPPAAPAASDQTQPPPPPLTLAEGQGLHAVQAAMAPPRPAGRMPTRDEAKRLLDHLEGRALGPERSNRVGDDLARSLSAMGHVDEALADSQPAEASRKKVLGPDHYWSKDSAGIATRRQCVVEGNEGPPLPAPLLTTAKDVDNETKGARILAHSNLEKPPLDPLGRTQHQRTGGRATPNPPLARAEATEIQRKFEEVWILYEERSQARPTCTAPWRPTPGTAARPAALLGHVEAPDAQKATEQFGVNPALHKRLLAQQRS